MKTFMLYRPNSAHERQALDFLRDFRMQTGRELEAVNVDTPAGIEKCRVYDIMAFPAILVTDDNGAFVQLWVGESLPRIGDVSYYVN